MLRIIPLCIATLPASFALLRDGFFSSSDGMIHLYRVFELDRAIHAGIYFPRWFPLSGYGYGLPVFNYYPPLAYYLAEFFHLLGAGYIGSIKLLIAFGFILAALSMFFFARDLLGANAAFVASIAFVYLPYLLSDAYIRGNFPEMLAMVLISLALYAFRNLYATRTAKFFILAALAFAAIILTHHLTAMLAAPLIGAYILFLFAMQRDWKKLLACIGAISLSLILSAFYWVPAITELNLVFVGPASLERFLVSRLVGIENFFAPSLAYTYLPQSDALQHSAGFPQTLVALLIGMTIVALSAVEGLVSNNKILRFVQNDRNNFVLSHSSFFFATLLFAIFMMLNLSASLWYAIPTLRFMQFPWRFQVLAGISIAFLIGVAAKGVGQIANGRWRAFVYSLVSLFLIFLTLFNFPDRTIPLNDSAVNLLHSDDPDYVVAQMGWSWTREFVPAVVQEENVIGSKQRAVAPETPRAIPAVRIENDGLLSRTTRVIAPEPTEISLHQFFFPGWQAYIDGTPARTYPSGVLGLVTVEAPAGDHAVAFQFEETPSRIVADILSAALLILGSVWFFTEHRPAFNVFLGVLLLLAAIVLTQTRSNTGTQPLAASTDFGHQTMLIGYSTERADDVLHATLYWYTLAETDRDYVAFVHLIGAGGEIIAQNDSLTDWGVTPTTRWQRGEMVTDRRALSLKDVPRGTYRLVAGMYLPRENGFENLAAYDRDGNRIGNQVELGAVEVGR